MEFQKEKMNIVGGEREVSEERDSNIEHQPKVAREQGCGGEGFNG